jgi:hypothetical protein
VLANFRTGRLKFLYLVKHLIFQEMSVAQIREELHRLIEQADETLLAEVYEAFQQQQPSELLTPEQRKDLDQRIARYKDGESTLYTWEEARKRIETKK